jgi:hypothetical protein
MAFELVILLDCHKLAGGPHSVQIFQRFDIKAPGRFAQRFLISRLSLSAQEPIDENSCRVRMRGILDDRQIARAGDGINTIFERRQRFDRESGLHEGSEVIDVQADGLVKGNVGITRLVAHDDKFLLDELF